jgi:hypothetical protein
VALGRGQDYVGDTATGESRNGGGRLPCNRLVKELYMLHFAADSKYDLALDNQTMKRNRCVNRPEEVLCSEPLEFFVVVASESGGTGRRSSGRKKTKRRKKTKKLPNYGIKEKGNGISC